MTSSTNSGAATAGRLTKLNSLDTVTASLSAMDMRRDSSSSSSSSVESCSPVTPTSEMMILGTSSRMSFSSFSSSSKGNDSSEEEVNSAPVFSSLPPRRVFPKTQSAGALACSQGSRAFPSASSSISSGASTPTSPVPARRIPSFPVSRPIRPFDSITNAMGTSKPYRCSSPPPLSEMQAPVSKVDEKVMKDSVSADGPQSSPIRKRFTIGDEQCLEVKQKSRRSTKLLEPPKNNRFQNGSFVLNMTQEEFKTRAWAALDRYIRYRLVSHPNLEYNCEVAGVNGRSNQNKPY